MRFSTVFLLLLCHLPAGFAQPELRGIEIWFVYTGEADSLVAVVGDFNGWSRTEDPMTRDSDGAWRTGRSITPGLYQYKFVVDGTRYVLDSANPARVENYDRSSENSAFVVTERGELQLTSTFAPLSNPEDIYQATPGRKPVFLNIIWHQHQPLYVDPETDQLKGPWVRTHATKDYYDMAAVLQSYPDIHCTFNLTSSLLLQLQQYYVDRLSPFLDLEKNRIDAGAFLEKWKGKTDPWIDLALKETASFDATDKAYIYRNTWNAFGLSEVMIARFPEYLALKQKLDVDQPPGYDLLTMEETRAAKFWFYLAHFDPDFLRGPVGLPDGSVCDLSDLVRETHEGEFFLKRPPTEDDCSRVVAEAVKVMRNVIPIHKALLYDADSRSGQIDVITTPYYHPILPLIYDSDLAGTSQSHDALPSRFSYPDDAEAHIVKAVHYYSKLFGLPPTGMWPGEGAVAQDVLPLLSRNGIRWTASDMKVLARSRPMKQPNSSPFWFPATGGDDEGEGMVLVFRDTELSDRIGFKYQTYSPEEAAEDFVRSILARQPASPHDPDVLITVILDGENAWEWYRKDNDGKGFLGSLYRKLTKLHQMGLVVTTTMTEYLRGNPDRNIGPHSSEELPRMEWLHPGSWINANYDTWIGEAEENAAWEALLTARGDLQMSGVLRPDPALPSPAKGTREWYAYMAWEAIYAAEGSDWFWWYGTDQLAPAGDKPFDEAFRTHLRNVYKFASLAGGKMPERAFPPIIGTEQRSSGQGTMAQSHEVVPILFTCDASTQVVLSEIFIAGNMPLLGGWTPNLVRMFDDGTHGDQSSGDGIWSLQIEAPPGTEILYKYTNSGKRGEWSPGEEFPGSNRRFVVPEGDEVVVVRDVFGKRGTE